MISAAHVCYARSRRFRLRGSQSFFQWRKYSFFFYYYYFYYYQMVYSGYIDLTLGAYVHT